MKQYLLASRLIIALMATALQVVIFLTASAAGPGAGAGGPFVHPGMLHGAEDLERIRKNIADGIEPWAGAWKEFQRNRFIDKAYQPHPLEIVGRGVGSVGMQNVSRDATAAYYDALAWSITGDENYAKKSIEILNAWSSTCKEINGKDAVLCAGIYGYKLANAAEIMRHSYKKWPDKEVQRFETWLKTVVYPVIKDFAPFANGNWDACCLPTMMSIGIFCDDRPVFDRAVRYYLEGAGNGSLGHYVINEAGQCQESGRDQAHTQLGLGMLCTACEIGFHQGIDLYSADDNRLLKGLEYTAQYNLGNDVPFAPFVDRTGKYKARQISPMSRGRLSLLWEMAYNHYHNRMGLEAPFTSQAATRRRPEPATIDQPGAGTLLFTLPGYDPNLRSKDVGRALAGPIVVKGGPTQIELRWPASIDAATYTVKRAASGAGPFTAMVSHLVAPSFTDANVEAGNLYYYVVSASNSTGESADSLPCSASAGLPATWTNADIGPVQIPGTARFDGSTFTLEGAGTELGGTEDQLHYVSAPFNHDGTLTGRFVPQLPSQFAQFGLVIREGSEPGAASVSLLVMPEFGRDVEQPGWRAKLVVREAAGAPAKTVATSAKFDPPLATWGRLMQPYWLRLVRRGNTFMASCSEDGMNWTTIGSIELSLPTNLSGGMGVCSRLGKVSTTAMFDHVSISGQP